MLSLYPRKQAGREKRIYPLKGAAIRILARRAQVKSAIGNRTGQAAA